MELDEGSCPKCSWSIEISEEPARRAESAEPEPEAPPQAIDFPMEFSTSRPKAMPGDWRSELKKKLERHYEKRGTTPEELAELPAPKRRQKSGKNGPKKPRATEKRAKSRASLKTADPPKNDVESQSEPTPSAKGEVIRQLFRYKLGDMEPTPERRIVTFTRESKAPSPPLQPLDKPLIRPPLKTRNALPSSGPKQTTLSLGEQLSRSTGRQPVSGPEEAIPVSREILVSRLLALIIDLVSAMVCGSVFAFVAASTVGAPFPSPQTIQLGLSCAAVVFFLSCVLFLFSYGQTPGMMWTDLHLVSEGQKDPRFQSVLIRTLMLPVSLVSILGFLWALVDPQCRCWHDRVSGTAVVPGYLSPRDLRDGLVG